MTLVLIILSALLSWFLCGKVRARLAAARLLDEPNDRSMHAVPVPRGGGWAIWLTVIPLWLIAAFLAGTLGQYIYLFAGLLVLIAISAFDDRKSLPVILRFGAQIFAVVLGLSQLSPDLTILGGMLPLWTDRLLTAIAWLWFINLTNFMDGIDGLSGANSAHIALGFLAVTLATSIDMSPGAIPAACVLGACAGFLKWNWWKAKLFLGDVGSIPMGFVLGYLLILLALKGFLIVALILPAYYLLDATYTLLKRIVQRKKFWQAHREHLYQQAALATSRHDAVVLPIVIANLALLLAAFFTLVLGNGAAITAPIILAALILHLVRLARVKMAQP